MTVPSRSTGTSGANPANNVCWLVAGEHPDHNPAPSLQYLQTPDIPGVLPLIGAVLVSVVLHRDFDFLPTHVEVRDYFAELVLDRNLRMWPR